MWYARDELGQIHYKSTDLYKVAKFCQIYNYKKKISKYRISDISEFLFNITNIYDVNKNWSLYNNTQKKFPLANKNYIKTHENYRENKLEKLRQIAKKYHCWPYNGKGRKADSLDL